MVSCLDPRSAFCISVPIETGLSSITGGLLFRDVVGGTKAIPVPHTCTIIRHFRAFLAPFWILESEASWCFPGDAIAGWWRVYAFWFFDFVPPSTIPANIQEFESEWADILAIVDPLKTKVDSIMLASRPLVTYSVENTFNSEYTRTREKLLMDKAIGHMLDDPWYTIKYKVYSAVRLWVIGIQVTDFHNLIAT